MRWWYRTPNEITTCPACGSSRLRALHAVASRKRRRASPDHRLRLVSGCDVCGLIFVNPPPTDADLAAYYAPDGGWNQREQAPWSGDKAPTDARSVPSSVTSDSALVELAVWWAARRMGTVSGLPALDYGCGRGRGLKALAEYGLHPVGLDPATAPQIRHYPMIDTLPEAPTYGLIVAKHVLEHLTNPLAILTACRRALRPNGILAIGVPTLDGLPQHGKLSYCLNENHHVVAFTRRSLSQLLARAGLEMLAYTRRIPHRCCAIATPATSEEATAPLRDAAAALRAYRRAEAGWWAGIVPVRMWAAWDNARRLAAPVE